LFARIVEVGIEIYRLFVNIAYHFVGYLGQSRFCVTVSRRGVSVHAAEVSVAVHESASYREVLRQSYQRVVYRHVAVRMIFTQNVAYDERALPERLIAGKSQFVHIEKNSSVNGFKTVSYVGDRTRYVYRHSVSDKRFFHFAFKLYIDDVRLFEHLGYIFLIFVFHVSPLIRRDRSRGLRSPR